MCGLIVIGYKARYGLLAAWSEIKKNTIIFAILSCSSMMLRPGNSGDFVIIFGTDV